MDENEGSIGLTRRNVLGGIGVGVAAATSGCLQEFRNLTNRGSSEQVSVSIKTVPADFDKFAVKIARHLEQNMKAVGMDASIEMMDQTEFLKDTILNNDFDLYVGRFPARFDPDFLRGACHSKFGPESGWQNPFGIADTSIDDLLGDQRETSTNREAVVADLAETIARERPFSPICFPERITLYRSDRFDNWGTAGLETPLGYLSIEPRESTDEVKIAFRDDRITKNLNPIAAEYRTGNGAIMGLLYDSISRRYNGKIHPWLASAIDWTESGGTLSATVNLRENLRWHDGTELTAEDVAFTYEFLQDTSLDAEDMTVPTPLYRGRTALVESTDTIDEQTVRIDFDSTARPVAKRALTTPVLPAHIWREKSERADILGIDISGTVTKALVWSNQKPVGSGPLRFESLSNGESLVLSRFEDHFLRNDGPDAFGVPFEKITFQMVPSDGAAVSLIANGSVGGTDNSISPSVRERITDADNIDSTVTTSRSFYHVGFNTRSSPFSNVRFRQAVSQLIDPKYISEDVFRGYATPIASPLAESSWLPQQLAFEGEDPITPFAGETGELTVDKAKQIFRNAGYSYNNGELRS